jgi:chitin-binding protein
MKSIFALSVSMLMAAASVSAHGYISQPPSRQARCRDVPVPNCGDVKYEPQSVEAPKGSFVCNGNGSRFAELNNEGLWTNYVTAVKGTTIPFTWTNTAVHATTSWEYFALNQGRTLLASFSSNGAIPPNTLTHQVPLKGYTGKQTILARWTIADTANAFYACVDINIS